MTDQTFRFWGMRLLQGSLLAGGMARRACGIVADAFMKEVPGNIGRVIARREHVETDQYRKGTTDEDVRAFHITPPFTIHDRSFSRTATQLYQETFVYPSTMLRQAQQSAQGERRKR